jgi:O-antigen ligase
VVSAELSILNLLTLICVVEFVVDCYRNPPNWLQCLFHLRLISFLLFLLVVFIAPFRPGLVLSILPGAGIRMLGNAIAQMNVICPVIVIISAYSFIYRLESRVRSTLFFLIGVAGAILSQTRGMEIALMLCLAILGVAWAKTGRRSAQLFIASFLGSILLVGVIAGVIGGDRIWTTFNRGQDAAGIASASGRTEMWKFAIQYCLTHPQGMGYIAGFRDLFTHSFNLVLGSGVTRLGTTHNAFLDVLADAGWLALALYLAVIIKIFALGWRFAKSRVRATTESYAGPLHAVRCGLLLFVFCMMAGMENSSYCVPLQGAFYYQNIIIAILLGVSATMIAASRNPHVGMAK